MAFISARHAFSLFYAVFALFALTAVTVLVVDLGRVRFNKEQLHHAVEAAARYGATGLADGTYRTKAIAAAGENHVDGSGLTLLSSDIEAGRWDAAARAFTVTNAAPNAIRVTGTRSQSRGNPIPLLFGGVIGKRFAEISEQKVVVLGTRESFFDIIATERLRMSGGTSIRMPSGTNASLEVACNGDVEVPWGTYIYGDVAYRDTTPSEPGNGITGTTYRMNSRISLPTISSPRTGVTNLGDYNVGSRGATLAAGNYRCDDLTFGGGGTIRITGNVTIYVGDDVEIGNGCIVDTNQGANKLTLILTDSGSARFNMSSPIYLRLYAPAGDVRLEGSTPFNGAIMCQRLEVKEGATLTYRTDLSLCDLGNPDSDHNAHGCADGTGTAGNTQGGSISTVQH